jgi:TonB family protein
MLQHLVRFGVAALMAAQVLPAVEAPPQSNFAPGVPRAGTPGVKPPEVVKQVDPKYSTDAMRAGIQGRAVLDAVIGADGSVELSQIRCSIHPSLDAQALKALSEWTFKPALLNGVPTPFVVEVEMEFRLHRQEEPPALPAIPGFMSSGSGARRTAPCTPPVK